MPGPDMGGTRESAIPHPYLDVEETVPEEPAFTTGVTGLDPLHALRERCLQIARSLDPEDYSVESEDLIQAAIEIEHYILTGEWKEYEQ